MAVPTVPGAASTSLLDLLTGPSRRAKVLAIFPTAVYLEAEAADTASGSPRRTVVAIVTAGAFQPPCSVVVAAGPDVLASARETEAATIGNGCVQLPRTTIVVRRWWRPRRPRPIDPAPGLGPAARQLASLLPPLPAGLVAPVGHLDAVLAADSAPNVMSFVARQLIGLGPGLTPAGDDVVAALLLTLWAWPDTRHVAAAVLPDAPPTTSLSAALLRHAARGEGLPQVVDLVNAVSAASNADTLERHVAALLKVGSSSGAALAHGVRLGLGTIAARSDLLPQTCEVAR